MIWASKFSEGPNPFPPLRFPDDIWKCPPRHCWQRNRCGRLPRLSNRCTENHLIFISNGFCRNGRHQALCSGCFDWQCSLTCLERPPVSSSLAPKRGGLWRQVQCFLRRKIVVFQYRWSHGCGLSRHMSLYLYLCFCTLWLMMKIKSCKENEATTDTHAVSKDVLL